MSCSKGCCESQAAHYRSLHVAGPDRGSMTKVTTDKHDTHQVDVTEHWHDQQDVLIRPETLKLKIRTEQ